MEEAREKDGSWLNCQVAFRTRELITLGIILGDAVPSTAGHGPHEGGPSEKSWLRRPRAEHPVSATGVQLTQGLGAATQAP